MVGRLWSRFRWQFWLGVLLSILSILSVTEIPALEWLGYLGAFGGAISIIILRLGGVSTAVPAILLGFVANVAFLTAFLVAVSRAVARRKGGAAAERGAA